jgi:hypothetical protein
VGRRTFTTEAQSQKQALLIDTERTKALDEIPPLPLGEKGRG